MFVSVFGKWFIHGAKVFPIKIKSGRKMTVDAIDGTHLIFISNNKYMVKGMWGPFVFW